MTTLLSSLNRDDYNSFLHKDKPLKLGEYEINIDKCHCMFQNQQSKHVTLKEELKELLVAASRYAIQEV